MRLYRGERNLDGHAVTVVFLLASEGIVFNVPGSLTVCRFEQFRLKAPRGWFREGDGLGDDHVCPVCNRACDGGSVLGGDIGPHAALAALPGLFRNQAFVDAESFAVGQRRLGLGAEGESLSNRPILEVDQPEVRNWNVGCQLHVVLL